MMQRASINDEFLKSTMPLTGNLSDLVGKRVGVDGNKIVRMINDEIAANEPFAALSSPVPWATYDVSSAVHQWSTAGLKLEIVFNGIPIKRVYPAEQMPKPRYVMDLQGRLEDSVGDFDLQRRGLLTKEMNPTLNEDGEDYLVSWLRLYDQPHEDGRGSIQTSRAPYWAWAQLASYLARSNKYLDEVYGCLELLAFQGVTRVITEINTATQQYKYFTKQQLLDFVNKRGNVSPITEEDLPAVFAMCSNHKLFNETIVSDFNRFGSFGRCSNGKLMDMTNRSSRYLARVVEFCPVMTLRGECLPLSKLYGRESPPLTELFGDRLPPIFYYAVMSGLLNPNNLGPIATSHVIDTAPSVDAKEYRSVSEKVMPLRAQIFHQLVLKLEELAPRQTKPMTWIRLYNFGAGRQIPLNAPPPIKLDEWDTRPLKIADQYGPYLSTVTNLAANACERATYTTPDAALASILLKSMDLLGYFTHSTMQPGEQDVSGPSIYSAAMNECTTATLSEYAVLLIELIRTQSLTDQPLNFALSRPSALAPDVLFASRLLSIIPVRLQSCWQGPVSAELAAFTALARIMQRSLRALVEVIATTTLASTREAQPPYSVSTYAKSIQPRLPFGVPLMSSAGVIVQYLMTEPAHRLNIPSLVAAFPNCVSVEEDLDTIMGFWYFAGRIIDKMCEEEQHAVQQSYANANRKLAHAASILNPTKYGYLSGRY